LFTNCAFPNFYGIFDCVWIIVALCFTCGKGYCLGSSQDYLASGFIFVIPLCLKRKLSLLITCELFGISAYHLIVWLSWLSCSCPCINSVNANVEIYGGTKLLKVYFGPKPSNFIGSPSLLIIVYQTLYLENRMEVANPKFNKDSVHALFGHGFFCCAKLERMLSPLVCF
jgi:hypothetical protein